MGTSTKNGASPRSRQRAKTRPRPAVPKLDAEIQSQLGTLFQRMYSDLLHEPVPERFAEILKGYRSTEPEDRS